MSGTREEKKIDWGILHDHNIMLHSVCERYLIIFAYKSSFIITIYLYELRIDWSTFFDLDVILRTISVVGGSVYICIKSVW